MRVGVDGVEVGQAHQVRPHQDAQVQPLLPPPTLPHTHTHAPPARRLGKGPHGCAGARKPTQPPARRPAQASARAQHVIRARARGTKARKHA